MIQSLHCYRSCFVLLLGICLFGCADPNPAAKDKEEKPTPIIGQTTQDIGEYDPSGDAKEADLQVQQSANPYSAAGSAYGFAVSEISKMEITKALQIYNAMNDRYPETYDEFMEEIIKKNNIQLPVLPGGRKYQYDVKNRVLVVVEKDE